MGLASYSAQHMNGPGVPVQFIATLRILFWLRIFSKTLSNTFRPWSSFLFRSGERKDIPESISVLYVRSPLDAVPLNRTKDHSLKHALYVHACLAQGTRDNASLALGPDTRQREHRHTHATTHKHTTRQRVVQPVPQPLPRKRQRYSKLLV